MTTDTESILDALHIFELPDEEQEELLNDLNELIFKGTLVRLLERMDEDARTEFTKLLDEDAPEEIVEAFIERYVPDSETAVAEAITELKDDILAVTKE